MQLSLPFPNIFEIYRHQGVPQSKVEPVSAASPPPVSAQNDSIWTDRPLTKDSKWLNLYKVIDLGA